MSHRQSFNIVGHVHFLTFSCFRRQRFLSDEFECGCFAESLNAARHVEHFDLWAYVIMPEHVHLLIRPRRADYEMASILRRIKEPVSRRILAEWRARLSERLPQAHDVIRGRHVHRFWQPGGGFDRNLYDPEAIRKAVAYIEWNPVRRDLVGQPEEWRWSSAAARIGYQNVPLVIDPVRWETPPTDRRTD
jgi:putative transposase